MDITKLKMVSQFWKTKSLILWKIYPGCFKVIKWNMMVKVNNLTWLLTISSARISLIVHPPPMRKEIFLPTIRKQGEMSVPWGGSAPSGCCLPELSFSLGRFSAPPIHQSPCCWALSLPRAAGLSPNVGCLMKALPVISHPPIPSSKSKLQATLKTKKGKEKKKKKLSSPEYPMVTFSIESTLQFCIQLPLSQYAPVNPEGHLQRNPLSVYPAWQVPLLKQGLLLHGFCLRKNDYVL